MKTPFAYGISAALGIMAGIAFSEDVEGASAEPQGSQEESHEPIAVVTFTKNETEG